MKKQAQIILNWTVLGRFRIFRSELRYSNQSQAELAGLQAFEPNGGTKFYKGFSTFKNWFDHPKLSFILQHTCLIFPDLIPHCVFEQLRSTHCNTPCLLQQADCVYLCFIIIQTKCASSIMSTPVQAEDTQSGEGISNDHLLLFSHLKSLS